MNLLLRLYGFNVTLINLLSSFKTTVLLAICIWFIVDLIQVSCLLKMFDIVGIKYVLSAVAFLIDFLFHRSQIIKILYDEHSNPIFLMIRFSIVSLILLLPLPLWYCKEFILWIGFLDSLKPNDVYNVILICISSLTIVTMEYYLIYKESAFYRKFIFEYAK